MPLKCQLEEASIELDSEDKIINKQDIGLVYESSHHVLSHVSC